MTQVTLAQAPGQPGAAHGVGQVRGGETESPVMPWDEILAIMRTMDELRRQWGLRYPQEPSTT